MSIYQLLCILIECFHLGIIVFMIGGIFVSSKKHPRFKTFHSVFNISVLISQALFSGRCPLSIFAAYVGAIGSDRDMSGLLVNPFIVDKLKQTFGFSIPDIVITILMFLLALIAVVTLISMWIIKKQPINKEEGHAQPTDSSLDCGHAEPGL